MDLTFRVTARIAKSVAEVFEAVANPDQLSQYFTTGGAKGRLETGATVYWDFADFPGAFPFRVARPGHARTLLLGLQPHALPELAHMHVVVEDDEPLRALLVAAGAELRLELLFLRGELP